MNTLESSAKRLLKAKDAAEYLSIGTTTLNKLRRNGKIRSVRICDDHRYDIKELDAFVDRQKHETSNCQHEQETVR